MLIDYRKTDENTKGIIDSMENKPFIIYVRYLILKGFSLSQIRGDLWRLGYSSFPKESMVAYYVYAIKPLIKKYKLTKYYRRYENAITDPEPDAVENKKIFNSSVIDFNYTFRQLAEDREQFCRLVHETETEHLWADEIFRFYTNDTMPCMENGEPAIPPSCQTRSIEYILSHPSRYLFDKYLLEGWSSKKVVDILKERHKIYDVAIVDLTFYAKNFFNFKRRSLEDLQEYRIKEQKEIEEQLELLVDPEFDNFSAAEKAIMKQELQNRLTAIKESILRNNDQYSQISFSQGVIENTDMVRMFTTTMNEFFGLFNLHKQFKERENIPVLSEIVKTMKISSEQILKLAESSGPISQSGNKDRISNALELIKIRYEERLKEVEQAAVTEEINFDAIGGADQV
jgi:hypothetical protein